MTLPEKIQEIFWYYSHANNDKLGTRPLGLAQLNCKIVLVKVLWL